MVGNETCGMVGIDTDGIETVGMLDGNHPETLPVTFENIPPDAFVGLDTMEHAMGGDENIDFD